MRRKKRSAEDDLPSTTTTPPSTLEPNKENNFKSEKMEEAMMKPFTSSPFFNGSRSSSSRRVKIDFLQNGSQGELPEGTVETISAGGGKAPGHHEGGGLAVKVKDET